MNKNANESFEKRMAKFKKLTKEIKKELFFHEDAEKHAKRKVLKRYLRLLKKKANLIRKLKKQKKLWNFKVRIYKDSGNYKLSVRVK